MAKASKAKKGKEDESPPFKKAVPVDLAEADIKKKEKRIVKALTAVKETRADMKLATSEHRSAIRDLEKEIDTLREQIEEGAETKEVLCVNVMDYRNNVVKTLRKDTRQIVETREMTAEERQQTFPELPTGAAKKKGRGAKPLPPGRAIAAARGAGDDDEVSEHGGGDDADGGDGADVGEELGD